MRMILSLCIDTLKTHVSVRGYMFFCPCPETNIASIVSGQLFVHVSMVYGLSLSVPTSWVNITNDFVKIILYKWLQMIVNITND